MKRFISRKNNKEKIDLIIVVVLVITLTFLHYYNISLSKKVLNYADSKVEEVNNIYVKKDIIPNDMDLSKLVIIKLNKKEEIIYVDIDMKYANSLLMSVVNKIQNNLFNVDVNLFKNLYKHGEFYYFKMPLGLVFNGSIISSLGPKIPIKLDLYDHALGNIETEVIDYGMNNALLKVYLVISLEQKIFLPYNDKIINKEYTLLLGSKVILGKIPSIYGGKMSSNSAIIEQ